GQDAFQRAGRQVDEGVERVAHADDVAVPQRRLGDALMVDEDSHAAAFVADTVAGAVLQECGVAARHAQIDGDDVVVVAAADGDAVFLQRMDDLPAVIVEKDQARHWPSYHVVASRPYGTFPAHPRRAPRGTDR